MTSKELEALVRAKLKCDCAIRLPDRDYAQPSKEWLLTKFSEFFENLKSKFDLKIWEKRWDCDNFASLYRCFAQAAHSEASVRSAPEEGAAVGEMWFTQDSGGGHAVNIAVCDDDIVIVEPQTCEELHLSTSELASVYFCRF